MTTATLTSLAILRVNLDRGQDYLEYLRPFVLQVLADRGAERVSLQSVTGAIEASFGLGMPARTVEIILKRICKTTALRKDHHEYVVVGDLPDPLLAVKQAKAQRHITSVLEGLRTFSLDTSAPVLDDEQAVEAVSAFLAKFEISCLRAQLRGTAIPAVPAINGRRLVLVSDYVRHLQRSDPERFESFLVLVTGNMLANALTCPDLESAPRSYRRLTFYLDTPLLIRYLGLEDGARKDAVRDLVDLLRRLNGKVAAFAHTVDEVRSVVRSSAQYLGGPESRPSSITMEAKKRGTSRSDLLMVASTVEERLEQLGVQLRATPVYGRKFQIDELAFEAILDQKLSYANQRAKEYDVNSVRSIFALRKGVPTALLEKSRAVLVTSNTPLAKAANEYGRAASPSEDVSSVITDFVLANLAWLKLPMGAGSIPATQLLSLAYAALEPSETLLVEYLKEMEKLEEQGGITERDHQLLRSDPSAIESLVHLTSGDERAVGPQIVRETLLRVHEEIRGEESQKLTEEERAHRETRRAEEATREALREERARSQRVSEALYWRCDSHASYLAGSAAVGVAGTLGTAGVISVVGLRSDPSPLPWLVLGSVAVTVGGAVVNQMFGVPFTPLLGRFRERCCAWLFRRRAAKLDIDLTDFEVG